MVMVLKRSWGATDGTAGNREVGMNKIPKKNQKKRT